MKGGVTVRYQKDGDITDEVMFTHEVVVKNIAYPELIQYIYQNLCLLVENAEEDLLDFKEDDNSST